MMALDIALSKKQQILIIGVVTLLILASVFTYLKTSTTLFGTAVKVVISPKDSTVTLDGKKLDSSKLGRVSLSKGLHTFTASRQYFTPVTKKVNTNALPPDKTIYLLPSADSQQALDYLTDHPDIQQDREGIGGKNDIEGQREVNKYYPYLADLPYSTSDYAIDFSSDNGEGQKPILHVTYYSDSAKTAAVNWMKSHGVNLNDIKVTYENPIKDYDLTHDNTH